MKKILKETILIIYMGFLSYALFVWKWALYASICAGLLGALSSVFAKTEKAWMSLAHALSELFSVIARCSILLFFPMALLHRLFVKDPLLLSITTTRAHTRKSDTLENFEKCGSFKTVNQVTNLCCSEVPLPALHSAFKLTLALSLKQMSAV